MSEKSLDMPEWLISLVEGGQVQSNAEQLISSISSVPRISLKGQKFRFIENGEEVKKESDKIHVVILGVQPEHGMAKTYYEKPYSGENEPPTCSSWDGIRPDSWITTPQSDLCATCKWNKWGSAVSKSGGKAKKCRDSKILMVVDPRDIENGTIYLLNVTVASLKNLSNFGKTLARHKPPIPLESVITTITMDEDSDTPLLHFHPAGILKQESGMKAIERARKKEWNEELLLEHRREAIAALESPESVVGNADQESAPFDTKPVKIEEKPAEQLKTEETTATGDEDIDALLSKW